MRFRNVALVHAFVWLGLVSLHGIDSAWARDHIPESEMASVLREIDSSFTIKNQPIHPGVVWNLEPRLSDNKPYIVTIDLRAAHGSNRYSHNVKRMGDGWLLIEGKDYRFSYKWLGRSENGVHVVRTAVWTGGSGVFQTLHFLRVSKGEGISHGGKTYSRINLTTLRQYALGDRTRLKIAVDGSKVTIKGENIFHQNKIETELSVPRKR